MSKTVLLVDDMAMFREPVAATLRLAGYTTVCAPNGRSALESICSTPPDLILLDVAMPEMDGMTFMRHLRSSPQTASIPVIVLTAASEKEFSRQASSLGAVDVMLKSRFCMTDLLDKLRQHLGELSQEPPLPEPSGVHNAVDPGCR